MIDQSKKTKCSAFITEQVDADTINKQFIEAPMNAARQPAICTGLDLLAFLSTLPDALIASEQRELERLSRVSNVQNDARIERLKTSIARTQDISSNANQGKARIERALVSLSESCYVFHGVVSDVDLKPLQGLTVRIVAQGSENTNRSLSSTTNADGYFSIPLDSSKTAASKKTTLDSSVKLSERMAELFTHVNAPAGAATDNNPHSDNASAAATDQKEVLAQVEILNANKNVIYQDPSPLVVNAGTAYREYVIAEATVCSQPPQGATQPETEPEPGRYLGNSSKLEIHNLQNIKKNCQIDEITPGHRVPFATQKEATDAGYDFCAYCFGKSKSKH